MDIKNGDFISNSLLIAGKSYERIADSALEDGIFFYITEETEEIFANPINNISLSENHVQSALSDDEVPVPIVVNVGYWVVGSSQGAFFEE